MGTALFPTKMYLWYIQLSPQQAIERKTMKNLSSLGSCVTLLGKLAELLFVRNYLPDVDSFRRVVVESNSDSTICVNLCDSVWTTSSLT